MLGTKKTESSDQTLDQESQSDAAANTSSEVGSLSLGPRSDTVTPPLKPFKKGSAMANPPSSSYRPEIPRKVVDIPNPARLQAERTEPDTADDGSRLVVGKAITVTGDISSCETLVVQGTVEANVSDANTIDVAHGGLFKGDAEVDHAFIAGNFEDTLKARQTLEVAESGHVKGTIYYNNISIASGGRVEGTIDVIDADKD